jgi:hypothetical protein
MLKEVYDSSIIIELISALKNNIKGKTINYTQIIITAMEIIDKYENLTGTLKKSYIIMAIDNISRGNYKIGLGDELISQENVIILKSLIEQNILSDLIDTIVIATKGKIDINKSSTELKKNCKFLYFC